MVLCIFLLEHKSSLNVWTKFELSLLWELLGTPGFCSLYPSSSSRDSHLSFLWTLHEGWGLQTELYCKDLDLNLSFELCRVMDKQPFEQHLACLFCLSLCSFLATVEHDKKYLI